MFHSVHNWYKPIIKFIPKTFIADGRNITKCIHLPKLSMLFKHMAPLEYCTHQISM